MRQHQEYKDKMEALTVELLMEVPSYEKKHGRFNFGQEQSKPFIEELLEYPLDC